MQEKIFIIIMEAISMPAIPLWLRARRSLYVSFGFLLLSGILLLIPTIGSAVFAKPSRGNTGIQFSKKLRLGVLSKLYLLNLLDWIRMNWQCVAILLWLLTMTITAPLPRLHWMVVSIGSRT